LLDFWGWTCTRIFYSWLHMFKLPSSFSCRSSCSIWYIDVCLEAYSLFHIPFRRSYNTMPLQSFTWWLCWGGGDQETMWGPALGRIYRWTLHDWIAREWFQDCDVKVDSLDGMAHDVFSATVKDWTVYLGALVTQLEQLSQLAWPFWGKALRTEGWSCVYILVILVCMNISFNKLYT